MERLPISVLINTFNEEKNIKVCLETVKWAEDIVIVDMYSEDKTVEIAKNYTDRIFFFKRCGYVEPARQFALEKAKFDWCLIVDADELVPYKMYLKIKEIINKDLADVVYFPRNNYFFGILLEGNGWGALQDKQPRLFKKNFMDLSPAIHSTYNIKNNARVLIIEKQEEGFIHFNYIDVEHFIDKLNRYTAIEAENMFKGLKKRPESFLKEIYLMVKEIGGRFLFRKGYKDKVIGLYLALLMGAYKVSSFLKLYIMEKYNSEKPKTEILHHYQSIAEKIIKEYEEKQKGN